MTVFVNGPAPVYARPVVVASGFTGPTGPSQGPTGPTGTTGAGPTGQTGPVGPTGSIGLQGSTGPQGIQGLSGPQGLTGPAGSATNTGATGAAGGTGPTGLAGTATNTGATGTTGPTGPLGTGPTGPTAAQPTTNSIFVVNGATNTTSASQMLGLGKTPGGRAWTITPATNGNIIVSAMLGGQMQTSGQNLSAAIYYGTGTAPSFAAAATGTPLVNLTQETGTSALPGVPIGLVGLLQNQAIGVALWFDILYTTSSGVIDQYQSTYCTAYELGGGKQGVTGTTGPQGLTGPTGFTGNTGATGTLTGPTGPSGGPTGSQGPTGAAGSSIIPINVQNNAYTTVLSDGGGTVQHQSADTSARTYTIAANAAVAYPVGSTISFENQAGAGVLTIAINSDTLTFLPGGQTGSRTLTAPGMATAYKDGATSWVISGPGLS